VTSHEGGTRRVPSAATMLAATYGKRARHQRAQAVDAVVEVVVAEGVDVDAHQIRGQHGRDVVEERRERWRSTEGVAGGDHERADGVGGALGVEVGLERGGAADLPRPTSVDHADRLELPVPVTDVDDRDPPDVG